MRAKADAIASAVEKEAEVAQMQSGRKQPDPKAGGRDPFFLSCG